MKKNLTKIGLFVLLCLCVLGFIGGIGYMCYLHQWHFAAGILVLGVAAFPTCRKWTKEMMSVE